MYVYCFCFIRKKIICQQRMVILKTPSTLLAKKRYVTALRQYQFHSCFELIIALFAHYTKGNSNWDALQLLLEQTEFTNFSNLDDKQMVELRQTALHVYNEWRYNMDVERLSYLLAGAINCGKVILIIDGMKVNDIQQPVNLTDQSVIAFFDVDHLKTISFFSY
ncbi:hypothetical protein DYU11_10745 [Fibrisoma montanum]|uniref:Uncharacterized protein n=2 Tax=Fibrisoma montanum TaxID=2305895 RepID=A0A418MAS8_9BACT|nr:hypothetical protein DYU11_10745 [Fibrisoma montanum]